MGKYLLSVGKVSIVVETDYKIIHHRMIIILADWKCQNVLQQSLYRNLSMTVGWFERVSSANKKKLATARAKRREKTHNTTHTHKITTTSFVWFYDHFFRCCFAFNQWQTIKLIAICTKWLRFTVMQLIIS